MAFAEHSCHRGIQFARALFARRSRIAVLAGAFSGAVWLVCMPAAVAQTNCTEAAVKHGVCTEVYRGNPTPQPSPQQPQQPQSQPQPQQQQQQPQQPSAQEQRRLREIRRQRDIQWSSDEAADYVKRGDWNNAIRSFEEALDNDPDNEALANDLANARIEKARSLAPVAQLTPVAQPSAHDQVGVQTNPGSKSKEGRAIRASAGRQNCGAGSSRALDQLKEAGSGKASVGCVMEGRSDGVTAKPPRPLKENKDARVSNKIDPYDQDTTYREARQQLDLDQTAYEKALRNEMAAQAARDAAAKNNASDFAIRQREYDAAVASSKNLHAAVADGRQGLATIKENLVNEGFHPGVPSTPAPAPARPQK